MKKFFTAVLILSFAFPVYAHELTIKAKTNEMKKDVPFKVTVQSAHKFIVPEEVEVLSRVKAGIIEDGKFLESELKANEENLCIDFTVTPKDVSNSVILVAIKDGETWSITNEGGKSDSRKNLEAKGLKVIRATKNDKYAKAIMLCNEMNKKWRWVKFSIDEKKDILVEGDVDFDISNAGKACHSFVERVVGRVDDTYPDFMRLLYS